MSGIRLLPVNKFDLYTLCAQNPPRDARALLAIALDQLAKRREAPVLAEDFSGAAALSRAWCTLLPKARAVAVDHDPEALAHARKHPRVRLIQSDVLAVNAPADVLAVLNFSICELHDRRTLLKYLKHARSRLRRSGCMICDIYGGADCFATGVVSQRVQGPRGERITYRWEQRIADPLTARVTNAMHFAVAPPKSRSKTTRAGAVRSGQSRKPLRLDNAFVYDWRLWSVPELRDAMLEAGFSAVQIYPRTADAIDQHGQLYLSPIEDAFELASGFNVFVVARR